MVVRENEAGLRKIVKTWKWKGELLKTPCRRERSPPLNGVPYNASETPSKIFVSPKALRAL